jgi:hypothetical protein
MNIAMLLNLINNVYIEQKESEGVKTQGRGVFGTIDESGLF